jgi:hypothetical protein
MGISGQIFHDKGIAKVDRDVRGRVIVSPATKFKSQPLRSLSDILVFIVPHLLVEENLTVDPAQEYANNSGQDLPVIFWDTDYSLFKGLTNPRANYPGRIYAVLKEDFPGILAASQAVVAFNPETRVSCRLDFVKMSIVDPNLPKVGQVDISQAEIDIYAWTVCYANRMVSWAPDRRAHGVNLSWQKVLLPFSSTGLGRFVEMLHDDQKEILEAIETTELVDNTAGNDKAVEN